MFDGLPNLRLPEAPGIRNAPTLRQRPDDAETPPAQFHLPTTNTGRTAQRPPLSKLPSSDEQSIAGVIAFDRVRHRDLLGGLIREYERAA